LLGKKGYVVVVVVVVVDVVLMHMDEVKCICMKPKIFWPPVNFKP